MTRPQIFKFIFGLLIGALITVTTIVSILMIWVATGPRPLHYMTPYLEKALAPEDGSYRIQIDQTWLTWGTWRHPIDIQLGDIQVFTRENQVFSSFPQISLGIDVPSLLMGRVLPASITITHPIISLYQNENRSISFGLHGEASAPTLTTASEDAPATPAVDNTLPLAVLLDPLISSKATGSLSKLRFITIRDADLSISNQKSGVFCQASNVELQIRRNRRIVRLSLNAHLSYDEYESALSAAVGVPRENPLINADLEFKGLAPGALVSLFDTQSPLKDFGVPLSGNANVVLDMNGVLQQLQFNVQGGQGKIVSEHLDGPLEIDALTAQGKIRDNFKDVDVQMASINVGSMNLMANGHAVIDGDNTAILADIALKNAPGDDAHLFWPPKLSPMSREWVIENITKGVVTEATAHIDIKPGDIAKPFLPKEDIEAHISIEGSSVRYIPEHPQATNVKGKIHIDGVSLDADIESAEYMKATKLSNGKLEIADLNADNPRIKLNFDVDSNAHEGVAFLKLPRLNHATSLNLNPETAEGTINAKAILEFDFFAPRDESGKVVGESDIKYDIEGTIKNGAVPAFMKKFDIENGEAHITINNDQLTVKGKGQVNGANATEAEVKYLFEPENGYDTFIDVKASAPAESLPRFGYPAFEFLKGRLGVVASLKQGETLEDSHATIDLTNAIIDMKQIGWQKPDQEPATLEVTSEKRNGEVAITAFKLEGKNAKSSGSATLTKDLTEFSSLILDKSSVGDTHLDHLNYVPIEGGMKLEAEGESANISNWVEADTRPGKGRHFSFEHFPALQFKSDIKRLILGANREITDFKGEATCTVQRCTTANVSGKTGEKPFSFRILKNPKGQRQLSLHAQDASAFLKALNVYDGMEEGDLTITGNYEEKGNSSILRGRLDIIDYTIKDAPILGQILSLASLTGFFDTLQGNGIRFSRLAAPFTLQNDVITFEKAKTHGPAIGMTMEGTITMPDVALDLEGTVVPAYTLNNVLGKVPIIGMVLTGGEGQGIIAARYSVKGTEQNPKVSVNPLSMLTPGFLRGLFDILDGPKKPAPDTEPDESEKSDKKE